jgi:hypothetical protein
LTVVITPDVPGERQIDVGWTTTAMVRIVQEGKFIHLTPDMAHMLAHVLLGMTEARRKRSEIEVWRDGA